MKDLFEVEFKFTTKLSVSPLAKGLAEPLEKIVTLSVPLLERVGEALVKSFEKENAKETAEAPKI
jgi:hypothetical protein